MNSRVAILGLVRELGNAAPFHDKKTDIWTMNAGFKVYGQAKINLLFEMHDWYAADYLPKYYLELRDIKHPKFKTITARNDLTLNNSFTYPIDDAVRRFGMFFKSSMSWMLAYASLRGYKEAFVYGCNLTEFQRHPEMMASFYHIEGVARVHGLRTHFVNDQMLEDDWMYGISPLRWDIHADLAGDSSDNYVRKEPDTWGLKKVTDE